MSTATFAIELTVQNVETDEHIESVSYAVEQAAALLRAHAIMILGEQCTPKLVAYGEDFARGRWVIGIRSPDEVE